MDDSKEPFCYTLEPPRPPKDDPTGWDHHARIVAGTYPVVIAYSKRFGRWLPILLAVKGRKGIRIHEGNTVQDSSGCILVGNRDGCLYKLYNSRLTLRRLMHSMQDAMERDESVKIEIVDDTPH